MATSAQITANRLNAQRSTGPVTAEGKAVVSRNATSHGLSSSAFTVLPGEDAAAYGDLLASLETEHQPATPTERFLVAEMAQAQWKLQRIAGIEAEILSGGETASAWAELARRVSDDCSHEQVLMKLDRHQQSARRAWYKALSTLRTLQAENAPSIFNAQPRQPLPLPVRRRLETRNFKSKPMPAHLERELDAHKRRDPLFDPLHDRSQMSKELQKYFREA